MRLAARSQRRGGGETYAEYRTKGIETSFAKITEEVRTQYTVGYQTSEPFIDSTNLSAASSDDVLNMAFNFKPPVSDTLPSNPSASASMGIKRPARSSGKPVATTQRSS